MFNIHPWFVKEDGPRPLVLLLTQILTQGHFMLNECNTNLNRWFNFLKLSLSRHVRPWHVHLYLDFASVGLDSSLRTHKKNSRCTHQEKQVNLNRISYIYRLLSWNFCLIAFVLVYWIKCRRWIWKTTTNSKDNGEEWRESRNSV